MLALTLSTSAQCQILTHTRFTLSRRRAIDERFDPFWEQRSARADECNGTLPGPLRKSTPSFRARPCAVPRPATCDCHMCPALRASYAPRWTTRFHVQNGRQEVMSCTREVVGMFKELIEVSFGASVLVL